MDSVDYTSQAETLRIINQIHLFAGIGLHEQHVLADRFKVITKPEGEIIIEQDEAGDKLYVIIEGHVLVSRNTKTRGWVRINTLGTGDVFGEIAILRKIPRTARITTETPCVFLSINAKDFLDAYHYFPQQSRDNIQLIIAKRLAELDDEEAIDGTVRLPL